MSATKHTVWKCKCDKCGHPWVSKSSKLPTFCPKCTNRKWNGKQKQFAKDMASFISYDEEPKELDIVPVEDIA